MTAQSLKLVTTEGKEYVTFEKEGNYSVTFQYDGTGRVYIYIYESEPTEDMTPYKAYDTLQHNTYTLRIVVKAGECMKLKQDDTVRNCIVSIVPNDSTLVNPCIYNFVPLCEEHTNNYSIAKLLHTYTGNAHIVFDAFGVYRVKLSPVYIQNEHKDNYKYNVNISDEAGTKRKSVTIDNVGELCEHFDAGDKMTITQYFEKYSYCLEGCNVEVFYYGTVSRVLNTPCDELKPIVVRYIL